MNQVFANYGMMALFLIMTASGCSLVIDPSDYESPGSESGDASAWDARASDASASQDGREEPDASPPCPSCDAGPMPDAMCRLASEPRILVLSCEDANGLDAVPTIETFNLSNQGGEKMHLVSVNRSLTAVPYVAVDFRYPGLNSLVLSAREPTIWMVSVVDGGSLSKIYLADENQTLLSGPADVPVDMMMRLLGTEACGYLPRTSPQGADCNTEAHIQKIADYSGRDVTSHIGCYQAAGVKIEPLCEISP